LYNASYQAKYRNLYYVRFVHDFTYFVAIHLIFLKILEGLVVDSFAENRSQKTITEERKRTVCYVCSMNRSKVSAESPARKRS
jgi:hypothetical protein